MKNQEPTNLEILDFLQEHMLTKEEAFLKFATKDDLNSFATKDDLSSMERRITGIVDDFIISQRKFDIELISIRHRVGDHEERIHTIETTK